MEDQVGRTKALQQTSQAYWQHGLGVASLLDIALAMR
jgi:hypothetical protein